MPTNNRDSDPPVSIPPIDSNDDLVITTGEGGNRKETLTIKTRGRKLNLILTRGDVRIEMPIDKEVWHLDIK